MQSTRPLRTLALPLLALPLLVGACSSVRHLETGSPERVSPPNPRAAAQFERLKAMEGRWISVAGADSMMADVPVDYAMTAGGHTLVETCFVGMEHEMVTNVHLDAGQLALTHYCMLGNQPHMIAEPDTPEDTIAFQCVGGGNLDGCRELHMHRGTYEFQPDGSVVSNWTLFENGEALETHGFRLVRR